MKVRRKLQAMVTRLKQRRRSVFFDDAPSWQPRGRISDRCGRGIRCTATICAAGACVRRTSGACLLHAVVYGSIDELFFALVNLSTQARACRARRPGSPLLSLVRDRRKAERARRARRVLRARSTPMSSRSIPLRRVRSRPHPRRRDRRWHACAVEHARVGVHGEPTRRRFGELPSREVRSTAVRGSWRLADEGIARHSARCRHPESTTATSPVARAAC